MFKFQINTQTTILHRAEVEIFRIFHLNNRHSDIQASLLRKLFNLLIVKNKDHLQANRSAGLLKN
jgi:hypothetical protein